jgi:hypothetical protein
MRTAANVLSPCPEEGMQNHVVRLRCDKPELRTKRPCTRTSASLLLWATWRRRTSNTVMTSNATEHTALYDRTPTQNTHIVYRRLFTFESPVTTDRGPSITSESLAT